MSGMSGNYAHKTNPVELHPSCAKDIHVCLPRITIMSGLWAFSTYLQFASTIVYHRDPSALRMTGPGRTMTPAIRFLDCRTTHLFPGEEEWRLGFYGTGRSPRLSRTIGGFPLLGRSVLTCPRTCRRTCRRTFPRFIRLKGSNEMDERK